MGTAVEKIFSRKAGRTVHSGEIVTVEVDCYMMHDLNGPVALDYFDQFHEKVKSPERGLISLCHLSPAPTAGAADHHKRLREILEHEAKSILREGWQQGRREGEDYGRMEQAKETAFNLRTIGLEEETIAKMVNVPVSVIREWFAEVVS